ncbi:MAG: tyrosine-protein phosphatase [Gammaproteobacteria bacterium]|nr:tyrosine-protein phosphatase [Gammaproteobacteria bacterium]
MLVRNFYKIIYCILSLLLLIFLNFIYKIYYLNNFNIVIPNKIYRSAQPTLENLQDWQKSYHIKTILNLRSDKPLLNTTQLNQENKFALISGITQKFIKLTASSLPTPKDIIKIIDILQHSPNPILIHCKHGVDRTSIMSAIAVLLDNQSVDQALKQFAISYGFLPFRKQEILKTLLYDYKDWLNKNNINSTAENFTYWAKNYYRAGYYSANLKILNLADKIPVNQAISLQAQITNTSNHNIPFTHPNNNGVYLIRCIYNKPTPNTEVYCDHLADPNKKPANLLELLNIRNLNLDYAKLFTYNLAPSENIIISFTLPPIAEKGLYILELNLMEQNRFKFNDYGNKVFTQHFEAV